MLSHASRTSSIPIGEDGVEFGVSVPGTLCDCMAPPDVNTAVSSRGFLSMEFIGYSTTCSTLTGAATPDSASVLLFLFRGSSYLLLLFREVVCTHQSYSTTPMMAMCRG